MSERLRVGYILKMFPRLSETFIMHELLESERQGLDLSVFSLMHPGDGRFHGRLSELKLTAEYFPSQKPEAYWDSFHNLPAHLSTPMERWQEAVEFLRRHEVPRDLEFLLRALMISARVRELGIRHLHAHFATIATRMAAVVGMLTGVRFSFTAHAKDIFRKTVDRELFADLVERSAFCVTVSDYNREFIRRHMPGVQEDKLVRLYNGVDLRFFAASERARVAETPHIVSVGRLVPKKGFDHLLHALQMCKSRGMGFRATIAGDGEQRNELLALRDRLGLRAEVAMPGALAHERIADLMRDATMIALACVPDLDGNMDALPTVLLEALALDLPAVSTRLTGVPEIIGGGAGVLCEPGDDLALSQSIQDLWSRIRSGEMTTGACRARAEKHFDLSKNVFILNGLFSRGAPQSATA